MSNRFNNMDCWDILIENFNEEYRGFLIGINQMNRKMQSG